MAAAAAAALSSTLLSFDLVYADGPISFNPLSSASTSHVSANVSEESKVKKNSNRNTSTGFDPEALVRGAEAIKKLNKYRLTGDAKKIFDILKKHEQTKQLELTVKEAEFKMMHAQNENERLKVIYEAQKKLLEHQKETNMRLIGYKDELARKRSQAEHESQRARNKELVQMQEESSSRLEQIRRASEEQIEALKRQTEKEKAEIERETIRVKAIAEAEGRAREATLAEDVNKRMLTERANAEREKWIAAINTTFEHIGGGFRAILTDRSKLIVAVGGVTALAAGVYTTREGAKVVWGYIDRILGQPSLIRESSRGKYPWSGFFSRMKSSFSNMMSRNSEIPSERNGFGDVILNPSLQKRIHQLAGATANTKSHQAPFRNMLFYGPPGTGKTMAARELARSSGLDYALMTGGDVAPLGSQAVTKIHQLFDWAKKSNKGLLLFIDEADAFLCERNKTYMSEAQRSALNALLFRTGDQSKDIVLALATNRPGDLDSAIADRIDEVLEFPLPGEQERFKLIKLYLDKYIVKAGGRKRKWFGFFQRQPQRIEIKGITDDVIQEAAFKTEGFSGREIAKLLASLQAAVYGSKECELNPGLFREVVDYKVAEHQQRRKFTAAEGSA